jgi:hypothetical protein
MFYDAERPDITLSDWDRLREKFPGGLISQLLNREDAGVPDWFMPMAWGIAIASDELLREAGDMPTSNWQETGYARFWHELGPRMLLTRQCHKPRLWSIERWDTRHHGVDEVLCFHFGSTPIFTRTYAQAMRLAMHCHYHKLPPGLRWIQSPDHDLDIVTEFARIRRFDERDSQYQQGQDNLRGFAPSSTHSTHTH